MAEKIRIITKKLKSFIKNGGRPGAKADFNNVLKRATTKHIDKSR